MIIIETAAAAAARKWRASVVFYATLEGARLAQMSKVVE